MKSRGIRPYVIAAMLAAAVVAPATSATSTSDPLDPPQLLDPADEASMIGADPAPADLRVVVAAPRAAINGGVAGVLPVARRDRALNVIQGETVRFISGVREAVWYRGRGRVESALSVSRVDPAGGSVPLGRDRLVLGGAAPKIAAGLAAVDVVFPAPGAIDVVAAVQVAAQPGDGRGDAKGRRVAYKVTVWAPGEMGSVSGLVTDEGDGRPIPGLRVLALDPATLEPVSAALTRCDGSYEIDRLPPGSYLVGARGERGFESGFFDGAPDAASATEVAVSTGASVTGIDLALARIGGN